MAATTALFHSLVRVASNVAINQLVRGVERPQYVPIADTLADYEDAVGSKDQVYGIKRCELIYVNTSVV